MTSPVVAARTVARVTTRRRRGPDAQVDAKALVFAPEDPALTDPFLALMEDEFSSRGFEWHPHRGLETVTTVLGGVLEHGDSLGNRGALQVGDVQWMTAGRGIIHRELAYRNERAHTLQLWVNLPRQKKMTSTRYQDVLVKGRPRLTRPGAVVDVVAGSVGGVRGRARTHSPITGAVLTLDPASSYEHDVPADHRLFAHVLSGEVRVAGRVVRAGQTAWVDPVGRDSTRPRCRSSPRTAAGRRA